MESHETVGIVLVPEHPVHDHIPEMVRLVLEM
jgi:hypothetical protein